MAGMTLTDTELAALRAIAEPEHAAEPGPELPWSILTALEALVQADQVELEHNHPRLQRFGFLQTAPGQGYVPEEPDNPHFWGLWGRSEALGRGRPSDPTSTTMLSDVVSDRAWRNDAFYIEIIKDQGLFHELGFYLPDADGWTLRLSCWRAPGRDFTERDRFLLTLLRPHIIAAHRAAERRLHQASLTARQLQLLELVSRGLTNRQVARALGLTEGTVRRHLENVYARLGVNSRTEALAHVGGSS